MLSVSVYKSVSANSFEESSNASQEFQSECKAFQSQNLTMNIFNNLTISSFVASSPFLALLFYYWRWHHRSAVSCLNSLMTLQAKKKPKKSDKNLCFLDKRGSRFLKKKKNCSQITRPLTLLAQKVNFLNKYFCMTLIWFNQKVVRRLFASLNLLKVFERVYRADRMTNSAETID